MTAAYNRLKSPEEIELGKKKNELARIQEQLAVHEQAFVELRQEIRTFEQLYEQILGSRIATLEDLEWQLKGLLGSGDAAETDDARLPDDFTHFQTRSDLLDDDGDPVKTSAQKSLKSLYREVAKAIHPDLASDDEQRGHRQELMAVANNAYENGDRSVLEDILHQWEQGPEMISGVDIAMELVRVIRQIARMQQNVYAAISKIDELKATDIYIFKQRVEESGLDGVDLMAEMAATLDLDIARTRRRLAALRGDQETAEEQCGPPLETRLIRFPSDRSCGMLYERNQGSVDYREWQRLGSARGVREVALGKAVRLDVKGSTASELSFLDQQQPDDLQALFMYDIDDSALAHLAHLSGLQELYLSNTTVSDKGLRQLAKLHGLSRLYIYHTNIGDKGLFNLAKLSGLKWLTCSGTDITEEGLTRFRQALPGCRAVNFTWRHGK